MNKRNHAIVIIIVFIAFFTMLGACNRASGTPAQTATLTPSIPPSVPAQEPSPTTDPSRYYNEEGKFTLELPDNWKVLGPIEVKNDPNRPFNLYILGPDPSPEGGPYNSEIIIADPSQWTPDQFAQSQCSTCSPWSTIELKLNGKPAKRIEMGNGGVQLETTWTFVENNGKLIAMTIHEPGSLTMLDDVINSIQFK